VTVDTLRLGAPWPNRISPAGMAVDDRAGRLYVVTKEDNSLYVVDVATHGVLRRRPLSGEGYTCLLSPDGRRLYVTVWGGDKVMEYDTRTGVFADSIGVGDNPNDMCLTRNGRYLYVASANDNKVSVIDTRRFQTIETLNAALYPTKLSGSTTNGVALSADGSTLYAANADNNCLAVFDVRHPGSSRSLGFIPTGWYPTCVRTAGAWVYVTNGKGMSSLANPHGPNPYGVGQTVSLHKGDSVKPAAVQYVGGGLLMGTLSIIPAPAGATLKGYTQAVYRNSPYVLSEELLPARQAGVEGNPVPVRVGDSSPIKYVFYIIKENRTYDQVMGDMREGNGDSSLVLFGEKVTPNQHALARQFVLLDNFYVDGEVSSDGHNWSMGAYADDFLEKTWPTMYSRRGGTEPSSGLAKTGNNKDGFIWDDAFRSGVTYRTYGEFISSGWKPNLPVLKDHFCTYFYPLNMHIFDTVREREWERDFDSLVAAGSLPRLMTVRFGNDHTEGTAAGRPTPIAHVADNDLAVGMFVEHLSHSPVWGQSVVFILEDDAQNGPDHVDAHRSNAYVAGGFVRRHVVDHTMYTTSSVLRTMELILGMPPMTQYDAAAKPMWNSFSRSCDTSAFVCRPARVDLGERNPMKGPLAARSAGLDFSKEDLVPDEVLNDIIWKAVRGEHAVCPGPVRAAFLRVPEDRDRD
jgi:YVTN family beta-propeller protein